MKAIVIDHQSPDINRDAGSVETINYINYLNQLGYEVYFSALAKNQNNSESKQRITDKFEATVIESKQLAKWLIDNSQSIHVVVIFRHPIATATIALIENFCINAKKIFFTTDLHFLREERAQSLENNGRPNVFNTRKTEIDLMYRFDATIVVSSHEKEIIKSIDADINVVHIPLARNYVGTQKKWGDRFKRVGFIGGYDHAPNIDAIENIIQNILPRLQILDPEITVVLAGSNMPEKIKNLKIKGLEQIGYVEDLSIFFDQLKCSIAPLRYGAGEKGKILSSLSHDVPVVSTTIGAESIYQQDQNIGVIVTDDHQKFAEAIVEICNNQYIFERYSSDALIFSKKRNPDLISLELKKIIEQKPMRKAIRKPLGVLLTVLLMTRSLSKANKSILNAWCDQVLNSDNTEIIILSGDVSDFNIFKSNRIKFHIDEDYFKRIKWGVENANGGQIQFASDDDIISNDKIESIRNLILNSEGESTFINDFLVFGKFGVKLFKQNFQYFSGVTRYIKFCESPGATPAFYSCFPKEVVEKWIDFLHIHKINHSYSDWLLLLTAFLNSQFVYIGNYFVPSFYNIENWDGHFPSEKSFLRNLMSNGYDKKLLVFIDLLWMYHSYMLIVENKISVEKEKELLNFIWDFFMKRFYSNISTRAIIVGLSDRELNFFVSFAVKINSERLNFNFVYECLNIFSRILNSDSALKINESISKINRQI